MNKKYIYIIFTCLLLFFLWSPLPAHALVPVPMNNYVITPPFVTQTVDPNILLVLDMSGSMQFPAYLGCDFNSYDNKRARCGTSDSTSDPEFAYDYDYDANAPYKDYYGLFDPDKYYQYDVGVSGKWEEASCSFEIGEEGLKIGDDSGNCISGNLLNWATMSRIDLLRLALVGGKSLSPQGSSVHTLRGEGSWRTYTDEFLRCTFTLSGGSYPSLDHELTISDVGGSSGTCTPDTVYSDDFNDGTVDSKWTDVNIGDASSSTPLAESGGDLSVNSNGTRIWGNSDDFRFVYQSVSGDFDIRLRIMNAPNTGNSSKAALMVRETTADDSKHVMVAMRGSERQLQFARRSSTGGNTNTFAGNTNRNSPEWVRLVRTGNLFEAYYSNNGTNWTYRGSTTVSMTDPVLIGMATTAYSSSFGNGVYDEFVYCGTSATGCMVGNVSNANLLIDVDKIEKRGIIQNLSDKDLDDDYDENSPRFGVEVFASNSRYGCMMAGIEGNNMSAVINAIQSEQPYDGTPQKYGLEEGWDYFKQANDHSNCNNSAYVQGPAMPKDPMYDDNGTTPVPCRGNYILLISDGEWNTGGEPVPTARTPHVTDIRLDAGMPGIQKIDLYTFYIFGLEEEGGARAMKYLAMFGAFEDIDDDTYPYPFDSSDPYPSPDSLTASDFPLTECDPASLPMNKLCREWDDDFDGIPDTYFEAASGKDLEEKLIEAITAILEKASSGTAASVLASGEGSGANILQAVFYPKQTYEGTEIEWIGALQNLWYYIDPFFAASSIREDTDEDKVLDLQQDYIANYWFDTSNQKTKANLYEDVNGDSSTLNFIDTIEFEELKNLWEAGLLLWERDLSTNPRLIKTSIGSGLMDFTKDVSSTITTLRPYLRAADDAEAEAVIRYINGEDTVTGGGFNPPITGFTDTYRSRTVALDLNKDGDTDDIGEEAKVWKLPDIINSTPKIASWAPLNTYDTQYDDTTYTAYVNRCVIIGGGNDSCYPDRGLVFTGGNGGMFHAFKLGKLQLRENPAWSAGDHEQARLLNIDTGIECNPATDTEKCGEEVWAFIPKNVLPYLKYNADITYDHIYNIDGTPYIFDASIGDDADVVRASDGSSWRTVLIGRMNYGGACRAAGAGCSNCVEAPGVDLNGDGDTADSGEATVGMSSYFAVDITDPDPADWSLLWEFSDEALGYSTTGPSVVRINTRNNEGDPVMDTNGEWFVVIASGPTGPIEPAAHQFLGRSDQDLTLFILDLRTGGLVRTIDTNISNAFGSAMTASVVDPKEEVDYQDDAVYIGYTRSTTGTGDTWTDGGIIRLFTKEDPDPGNWVWSNVIQNTGAITAAIDHLQNTISGELWLYFGSGRYYYKLPNLTDDPDSQRRLYGIKEPCYASNTYDMNCVDEVDVNALEDVSSDAAAASATEDAEGWFIDLEDKNVPVAGYDAERVITNPIASTTKVVYYTTFKPSADICGFGGITYIWAAIYNTGGSASAAGLTKGRALIQVSTGAIEEKDLSEAFKENDPGSPDYNPDMPDNLDSKGDRRTAGFEGKPPEGSGMIILTAPPPANRIMHMRER